MITLRLLSCFAVLVICLVAGCTGGAKDTPETVPVGGAVMYNGEPVAGATVSFMAESAPRAATGVTNAQGEFQLSTFGVNDGAVPGVHTITVTKIEGGTAAPATSTPLTNDPTGNIQSYVQTVNAGKKGKGSDSVLPQKYGSHTTTPLKETVTVEGPNQFPLQLTD